MAVGFDFAGTAYDMPEDDPDEVDDVPRDWQPWSR